MGTPEPTPRAVTSCAPMQRSLLACAVPAVDPTFHGLHRRDLGDGAWVDHVPGWVAGADAVFDDLVSGVSWQRHDVRMYDRVVAMPRLTAGWDLATDAPPVPVVRDAARALADRYGGPCPRVGANLYRDGADSVAWHGDRVLRDRPEGVVCVVSLGSPRSFRLRPTGGGRAIAYRTGPGDLLVMGGTCQRTWQHSVPKASRAGPRISLTFRRAP